MIENNFSGLVERTLTNTLHPYVFLSGKFAGLYESSPNHKYDEGDILILNGGLFMFGYGIRPIAKVNAYKLQKKYSGNQEGIYDISLATDADFIPIFNKHGQIVNNGWDERNAVPKGVERKLRETSIIKWNLEFQFEKVPEGMSFEDAVKLYGSKEEEYFFELR
ncbi:MAG: hypothetical protein KC589_10640 [Nanoarchaeota archaeon]|nr:hypothetical protein [Nanoarchaeota archaeon]